MSQALVLDGRSVSLESIFAGRRRTSFAILNCDLDDIGPEVIKTMEAKEYAFKVSAHKTQRPAGSKVIFPFLLLSNQHTTFGQACVPLAHPVYVSG